MCVCMSVYTHVPQYMCGRSEDNFVETALFVYPDTVLGIEPRSLGFCGSAFTAESSCWLLSCLTVTDCYKPLNCEREW